MNIQNLKYYVEYLFRTVKFKFQKVFRGYSDADVSNLSSYIIGKIRAPLNKFVTYQAEHGMALPSEFATDPAKWLEILQKIEFSVNHYWKQENDSDYSATRNMGIDEIDEFNNKVDEGFLLLGKYMRYLWN